LPPNVAAELERDIAQSGAGGPNFSTQRRFVGDVEPSFGQQFLNVSM
jgi:hypothetical protein